MPVDQARNTENQDVPTVLSPYRMQDLALRNRVVMPAMTRGRAANAGLVPTELMAEYYAQRASAGFVVSEGTWVSERTIGYANVPGLYSQEQVKGWKQVTDAVHRKGGLMLAQLWHVGALSLPYFLNGATPAGPSAVNPGSRIFTPEGPQPTVTCREMSKDEIRQMVADFAHAARNAYEAGFDGVQVQVNFQYIFAQFLHTAFNKRSDEYGGTVENRARAMFETLDVVFETLKGRGIGVKVGPATDEVGLFASNEDTIPAFDYVLQKLNSYDLSHIFIMGLQTDVSATPLRALASDGIFEHARRLYKGTLIANAGFDLERANRIIAAGTADLVGFARPYITNPDLVERFRENVPLATFREKAFYAKVNQDLAEVYIDYPRATGQSSL